jgi:hypothetical protein
MSTIYNQSANALFIVVHTAEPAQFGSGRPQTLKHYGAEGDY